MSSQQYQGGGSAQKSVDEAHMSMSGSIQNQSISQKQLSYKSAVSGANQQHSKTAMDEHKKKMKEKAEQENSNIWQHPYVDVFKHFKVQPGMDWKSNKKQGDVNEYFAKEIGRRAISIEGTISANNYVQVPNTTGPLKSLGLTGRYIYFQVKCPRHGLPFSYHVDLGMAERSHGVRLSVSNLFKSFSTSNGFVAQIPLELKNNCWTIVVIDIIEVLKRSSILPPTYLLEGSYQVRSITVCANTHARGVFTSDNLYDFVTLPADMRYKFAFELSKWMEYFDWQQLPQDWDKSKKKDSLGNALSGDSNMKLGQLIGDPSQKNKALTIDEKRVQMRQEIDALIEEANKEPSEYEHVETASDIRKKKYQDIQNQLNMQFNSGPGDHPVSGYIMQDEDDPTKPESSKRMVGMTGTGRTIGDYRSGTISGHELSRSHKLNKDPIMELKHIIGYQADKCFDMKWSKQEGENVVLFTSGGTLIAMDSETNEQKRFFFGHSAPICCFDLNFQGNLIASAQEGKNSIIRLWDYSNASCITMVTMPVTSMKCLSFSPDGQLLASVGKDAHQKEMIIVWDISRVQRGEKPEVIARQTSEFNILKLKFSPIDPLRMASCGKENIRLWRIRDKKQLDTANIRGSAVVLNHHARDTVFTCLDFEYGFRATDKQENESLKRIFVGSKHGIIYQVNYQTEQLEATFKTNDKAIYSISVNDAFCCVGSEDSYLRVWPLDFQEFFMEAQHEGPVSCVDISTDGLKVVCGTLYGSIGILDKSNQNYKTLLRSHTDEIVGLDFHKQKMNIITTSRDKTIRLWDIKTMEEVYEFSSPFDQPLSLSAHPTEPIFACGFQSGKMRIFNIESTEVTDEFSQFKRPLMSLSYDNTGRYLVTCSEDGAVSIHNAARQHLPIKMMHLEMPPEFVHVTFTQRVAGQDDSKQRFAVMGEYGNNVIVYDTESFLIQHQIMVNNIVKSFKFANNNNDLLVVTKDCKIRFYCLMKYEGLFLREISSCHRGAIKSLDVSINSGYMLSAGEDTMIRVWDYEVQKTTPYFFQSFIGHTYPLTAVLFNPINNGQVITVGQRDGIYVWDFNGDVENDYHADQPREQDPQLEGQRGAKKMSMLEQIRQTNKARKEFRAQIRDDSFILPQCLPFERYNNLIGPFDEFFNSPNRVTIQRGDRKLTYNHYCNMKKRVDVDVDTMSNIGLLGFDDKSNQIKQNFEHKLINGYDGFGGAHDNLHWNVKDGFTYFTLNNKLIIEETKTRRQTVFADSQVQLSCLAVSKDGKYIATGEGSQNPAGTSLAYLYDVEKGKLITRLTCHQKGIQSMAFFEESYLITVGVQGENSVAIWNLRTRVVEKSALLGHYAVNQIRIDPNVNGSCIQFITVGNNSAFTVWRYDIDTQQVSLFDVTAPEQLNGAHFCSVAITDLLEKPGQNKYDENVFVSYAIVGTSEGQLVAFDMNENQFERLEQVRKITKGEIGTIQITNKQVIFGSSDGVIARYQISGQSPIPTDFDLLTTQKVDAAIMSMSMDEGMDQGLVGTEAGSIFYVNFTESVNPIKLVSSNNMNQDPINVLKFDFANPKLFLSSCGPRTDQLKISTGENCDQVHSFTSSYDEYGHVVFVIGHPMFKKTGGAKGGLANKQIRLIGFSNGFIKVMSLKTLNMKDCFKVPINREAGEVLTCGQFSANNKNFAFGTNHGTLFFGNIILGKKLDANYAKIPNAGKCNNFDTSEGPRTRGHRQMNSDIIMEQESLDIDNIDSVLDANDVVGISSISFPFQDPIGIILVAFTDGTIRMWQSTQNPNLIQIIKLQNNQAGPALFDVFSLGYQQYDIVDNFDIFQNPDDLEEVSEEERNRLKSLYKSKQHPTCQARFFPGTQLNQPPPDLYLCFVEALQFVYIRNWKNNEIIKRIALNNHPSCLQVMNFQRISRRLSDDSYLKETLGQQKTGYLLALGTKDGKVLVYKVNTQTPYTVTKLLESKAGNAYGGITQIDIVQSPLLQEVQEAIDGDYLIAGTESGEIHQFELMNRFNFEE